MKFRFCGDGDCPDWILAEINSTLSFLSSIKLRQLTQSVAKSILGEEINEDKIKDIFGASNNDMDRQKSAFSSLRFLLINAVQYQTDTATFNAELQQLGLPREHSMNICRVLDEYSSQIKLILSENSLTVNKLDHIAYSVPQNTVDCIQLELNIGNELVDAVSQNVKHNINVHKMDIPILLNELKTIRKIMTNLNYDQKYEGVE